MRYKDGSNKTLSDWLASIAGFLIIVPLVIFGPLFMGFTDFPSKHTAKGKIVLIHEQKYPHLTMVSFLYKDAKLPITLCVEKGLDIKEGNVKIEYGRGWFMPYWYCSILMDKITKIL